MDNSIQAHQKELCNKLTCTCLCHRNNRNCLEVQRSKNRHRCFIDLVKKEVKKEVETKLDFTTDIEFIMKSVKRKAG